MRALRLLAANLIVLLLLLVAVEGGVRLTHPAIRPIGSEGQLAVSQRYGNTPGLRPNARGLSDGAALAVDSLGFWHYERAAQPSATRAALPAWLFLGDSVTMGIGVDPDATFAGRMAAALDTVRVLNPSLVGYQPTDYVALLRALLADPALRIERVTVFWCLNDAYAPRSWYGTASSTVQVRRGPLLTFLRRHVYTYQWAKATFADRPLAYFRHDQTFYASDSAFAFAAAGLNTLTHIAGQHGVRLDLVALPYEAQLRTDAPADWKPQRRLEAAAALRGLPFFDAAQAFARVSDPATLYRYGDGIHFSERGHALLARYLLTHL